MQSATGPFVTLGMRPVQGLLSLILWIDFDSVTQLAQGEGDMRVGRDRVQYRTGSGIGGL